MHSQVKLARQRALGSPLPSVEIICPYCKNTEIRAAGNHQRSYLGAKTFYFRRYSCVNCEGTIWIAIDRDTNDTLYPSISPISQSFFEVVMLFTHEQVLNNEFKYSPRQRGAAYSSVIRCKADLLAYRKEMLGHWQNTNGYHAPAGVVDMYLRTFNAWMKELPDTYEPVRYTPLVEDPAALDDDAIDSRLANLLPR